MEELGAALKKWRAQLPEIEPLVPWAFEQFDEMFDRVPIDEETRVFEQDLQRWALDTGLYPPETAAELADGQFGMVACYVSPDTPDEVRWPIGMYFIWVTSWDDGMVEQGTPVAHWAPVIDELVRQGRQPDTDTPSTRGLLQLRDRVLALGGEDLLDEFADQLALQFRAWTREQQWIARGELPALGDYLPHHGCTMGLYSSMLLHRLRGDLLPPSTRFPFMLDYLARSTNVILGIHNDLSGCRADLERDYPLNTVAVLARQYDLDLATAFRCGVTLLAAQWNQLRRLADDYCAEVGENTPLARQARSIVTNHPHGFHTWNRTAPRQDLLPRETTPYLPRAL